MIISVLKVIGIIILVILAVLILLVGIVCFTPIRYRFHADMEEEPNVDVIVKWMPVFLKVKAGYHQKVFEYRIRLLGGLVMTNTEDKLSWIGRRFFSGKKKEAALDAEHTGNSENTKKKAGGKKDKPVTTVIEEDEIEWDLPEEKRLTDATLPKQDTSDKKARGKKVFGRKKSGKVASDKKKFSFKEFKEKIQSFMDKLKDINNKKDALLKVYHSQIFKRVKEDVKRYIKDIIKIIKPDKLSGYVEFGLDDPATTGEIFGGLAVILPLYQNYLTVVPNFEEQCVRGNLDGKGKIYLISVIILAIKVIFNKNLIKVKKKVQTILEA